MLKGLKTKVIILIITGLLIPSVPNIPLFKVREELDEREIYSEKFNINPLDIILTAEDFATKVIKEDFDYINLEHNNFNNMNLDLNQKTIISLVVIIGTSSGFQILGLIRNEQKEEVQESKAPSKSTYLNLSIEESQVLIFIEEFLNKNRVCSKPELVSFIKNRNFQEDNPLNHNGIEHVIDSLVAKHVIVEGSKITRFSILSNLNRRSIYEEIKNNPGNYLNKISKNLGLSIFLTNWHLNILLRFNIIRKLENNNQIAYFDSELSPENDNILQIISRVKCSTLIEYLKINSKGSTKSQIAKTLKMHHTTVNKYLEILVVNQIVNLETLGKRNFYCLNNEKLGKLKYLQ